MEWGTIYSTRVMLLILSIIGVPLGWSIKNSGAETFGWSILGLSFIFLVIAIFGKRWLRKLSFEL